MTSSHLRWRHARTAAVLEADVDAVVGRRVVDAAAVGGRVGGLLKPPPAVRVVGGGAPD